MKKNKMVAALTISSLVSQKVMAIDLQTRMRNSNKKDFDLIGSGDVRKGELDFHFSNSLTKNPLVLQDEITKETTPLVRGLHTLEMSVLYGLTDKLQIGLMVPAEQPYGVVAPYSEAKWHLGDILIEPTIHLVDGLAIIPMYYLATGDDKNLVGTKKGAYGAKVVKKMKSGETTYAFQIGAIIAEDNVFESIDQRLRESYAVGMKTPLGESMNFLTEIYAEKTKNNFPLEAMAFLEYKQSGVNYRLGLGSGDLRNSGSNDFRGSFTVSMSFGNNKNKKVQAYDLEEFNKNPEIKKDEDGFDLNENPVRPDLSKVDCKASERILASLLLNKDHLCLNKKNMEFEKVISTIKNNLKPKRYLASVKQDDYKILKTALLDYKKEHIEKMDNLFLKNYPEWAREKAKITYNKLINAYQVLDENLELYDRSFKEGNEEALMKYKKELAWGLRVIQKRSDYLNFLESKHKEYSNKSFMEEGLILPDLPVKANISKVVANDILDDKYYAREEESLKVELVSKEEDLDSEGLLREEDVKDVSKSDSKNLKETVLPKKEGKIESLEEEVEEETVEEVIDIDKELEEAISVIEESIRENELKRREASTLEPSLENDLKEKQVGMESISQEELFELLSNQEAKKDEIKGNKDKEELKKESLPKLVENLESKEKEKESPKIEKMFDEEGLELMDKEIILENFDGETPDIIKPKVIVEDIPLESELPVVKAKEEVKKEELPQPQEKVEELEKENQVVEVKEEISEEKKALLIDIENRIKEKKEDLVKEPPVEEKKEEEKPKVIEKVIIKENPELTKKLEEMSKKVEELNQMKEEMKKLKELLNKKNENKDHIIYEEDGLDIIEGPEID